MSILTDLGAQALLDNPRDAGKGMCARDISNTDFIVGESNGKAFVAVPLAQAPPPAAQPALERLIGRVLVVDSLDHVPLPPPDGTSFSAFLAFKIGSGQFNPLASSSSSKSAIGNLQDTLSS